MSTAMAGILIMVIFVGFLILASTPENPSYTTEVCVDRIEENIVVFKTINGYTMLVDREIMPEVTEGDVVRIRYTIDVEASAELRDKIETLQVELLERN